MPLGEPNGRNPYKGRQIPKGRIQWAIENSLSLKGAARVLGVSYNTFKKYAIMYDLFEQNKNIGGAGVPKGGSTGFGVTINDIFGGKHPNYPHWKLQQLLVRSGHFVQKCSNCGYDETREVDGNGPFIIDFLDGDGSNHVPENIRLLCYNCFFLIKQVGKMIKTPKDVMYLRRNMWKVFKQTDREKEMEKEHQDSIPEPTMDHKKEDKIDTTVDTKTFGDLSDVNITLDDLFKDD